MNFPNTIDIHINTTDANPDATKLMIVNGASSIIGNMIPFNAKNIIDMISECFTRVKKGFLCPVPSNI